MSNHLKQYKNLSGENKVQDTQSSASEYALYPVAEIKALYVSKTKYEMLKIDLARLAQENHELNLKLLQYQN